MLKSSKTERFSRRNASIAFRPNGRKLSNAKEAELIRLAISKLGSSGLSLEDARQLGIEVAGGTLISELHPSFHPIAALKINYFAAWIKKSGDVLRRLRFAVKFISQEPSNLVKGRLRADYPGAF